MAATLLNHQKSGMVENSEFALEKKMSQVQNPSLLLPGGMVFTSLFNVLKSHFIICRMKYNNTSFYIIGIWWGLNKKTSSVWKKKYYCFRVIELMFF